MESISLKTKYYDKKKKNIYLINVKNKILGRFSSTICNLLIGKNSSKYTPNYSFINKIIIINANKIKINKKKIKKKKYYKYSGYIGNKKEYIMNDLFKKNPCILIKKSIERMLPKNLLGSKAKKNIYIFKKNHNLNYKNIKIINI
ncbi:MAG: 50S ribosomal protein L13 [Candidatus Shikimatogenerans bostrichidophilus]|nr:MAG: 50S ribosomal protein L13 [Candidatus Shikimatogenerans bostrichidophilus]